MSLIDLCERGFIPDRLTRAGMRALIAKRLVDEAADDGEFRSRRFNEFIEELLQTLHGLTLGSRAGTSVTLVRSLVIRGGHPCS